MASIVETEFLVAGAGPAGGSLAAFLAQHGLKGIVVCKDPSTADTPRAHIFNPFALECLRDIDLEDEAKRNAVQGEAAKAFRWCRSMVDEEYGKVLTFGSSPTNIGLAMTASPCEFMDLPQSYMEPIVVRYASQHGFEVRSSTELVQVERTGSSLLCTVRDNLLGQTFQIRTKYLFGGDGARSQVARSLDFSFQAEPQETVACNVLFNADLTHLVNKDRVATLHWILKADREYFPGSMPVLRIVRPWKEWMMVVFNNQDPEAFKNLTAESPEVVGAVRESIGDDSVEVDVLRVDAWMVREIVAEKYADAGGANAFLLGDAAHRHPPAYGLGSNTCVQDAYNLAWKVAYVSKGLAGPGLLNSYSEERQPVGAMLVREANEQLDAHMAVWEAMGNIKVDAKTREEGAKQAAILAAATPEGAARRAKLYGALAYKRREADSLGICMNQWYVSSAVYLDDEPDPRPPLDGDFFTTPQITTYPGSRVPHAWLDVPARGFLKSTQDLAGKTAFCLLIGIGGGSWREAAAKIARDTGIPVNVYGIGFGLDYHDVYRDWYYRRGVEEDGCVLVRPDRFVAWRAPTMVEDCEGKLLQVLNRILSRHEL